MTIHPAPPGHGIVFQRMDLPTNPFVPARLEFVVQSVRCTKLQSGSASVWTVEHFLSAVSALGIDNLLVCLDGPEIPIFDGSARTFVEACEEAGVVDQDEPKKVFRLHEPLFYSQNEIHLIALPCEDFRVSYTLHYPSSKIIGSQYFSVVMNPDFYKREISSSRTFSEYEEIRPLIEQGLIKGGGLESALVVKEDRVLNPEGMRYPNEMVRHKILDLLGDFALMGGSLAAHIFAVRSGHAANIAFARKIVEKFGAANG